jgi:hypothetical protein
MNGPRRVTAISVIVEHDDGRTITYSAVNPVGPQVEFSLPHLPDIGQVDMAAPWAIAAPGAQCVRVEFKANPRRPVVSQDIRGEASGIPVVVGRDDLETVYTYARHFGVDEDPAMMRVASALAATWNGRPDGQAPAGDDVVAFPERRRDLDSAGPAPPPLS